MSRMLIGAFGRPEEADQAIYELEHFGYTPQDISVISQHQEYRRAGYDTGESVAKSAAAGATTGGAIGGLAGLLAGIGIVPILAGLFVGGPLAAALGLAGAAATTVSGAVTGAAAGGLIGALTALGLPKHTAEEYNQVVDAGGVVIGLSDQGRSTEQARAILERHGAKEISIIEVADREPSRERGQMVTRREPVFGERVGDDEVVDERDLPLM